MSSTRLLPLTATLPIRAVPLERNHLSRVPAESEQGAQQGNTRFEDVAVQRTRVVIDFRVPNELGCSCVPERREFDVPPVPMGGPCPRSVSVLP